MELSGAGSGAQKGAVFLMALGADAAARVLSHMPEAAVEKLIREMSRVSRVTARERDSVLDEFLAHMEEDPGAVGGVEYARQVLEQSGVASAGALLEDLSPRRTAPASLAEVLEQTSGSSVAALVSDEHPQVIALLLGQLPVEKAAVALAALPQGVQAPVAARLAEMDAPAPIALQHLERCILDKLGGSTDSPAAEPSAGPRRVADILGRMRRSIESVVMGSLEEQAPEVARRINRYRLTFEDLLALDARSIQRILRELEIETLQLAMKGLDEQQQQVIFSNMSERAAERLREDLANSGPARLREVEDAQQAMVAAARRLHETGELQLALGETDEEPLE